MAAEQDARGGGDGSARPVILSLAVKERPTLYATYMPFLRNGGVFIPTDRSYRLGEEIYLILTLMDEPTKYPLAGRIAWVTPPESGHRQQGIGVHFPADDAGRAARKRIEELLGSALKSGRPTHTI
jgi:type IV pilus assembly protein PilZ